MSKTDKTQPWWCQVTKWEPFHMCIIKHRECDLPDNPPRSHGDASWRTRGTLCCWQPVNWHEVTFSRYDEWYNDKTMNRSRAKRQWRKDWNV